MRSFAVLAASFIGLVAASHVGEPVGIAYTYEDDTYSNIFPVPADGTPYPHPTKDAVTSIFVENYWDGSQYLPATCKFIDESGEVVQAISVNDPTEVPTSRPLYIESISCLIG
ncbi:hypothetical protein PT974_10484 [Cladobotryum mycophilum]|uniref:Uncharacterized protein n=1 Tax=Cladobotryum mycophilum TaxID=491253 RepID=A0ABR0SBF9_9HYPO